MDYGLARLCLGRVFVVKICAWTRFSDAARIIKPECPNALSSALVPVVVVVVGSSISLHQLCTLSTHTFGTLIASDTRITRPAAHGDVGAKSVLIITKFQIISSPHN